MKLYPCGIRCGADGRKQHQPKPPLAPIARAACGKRRGRRRRRAGQASQPVRGRRADRRRAPSGRRARTPSSAQRTAHQEPGCLGRRASSPEWHSPARSSAKKCSATCPSRGCASSRIPPPGSRVPSADARRAQDGRAVDDVLAGRPAGRMIRPRRAAGWRSPSASQPARECNNPIELHSIGARIGPANAPGARREPGQADGDFGADRDSGGAFDLHSPL